MDCCTRSRRRVAANDAQEPRKVGLPIDRSESGTSLIELMIALLIFSGMVIGILPIMHQASLSDRGAHSTTHSSYVAGQIMETLKMYRAMQIAEIDIPDDLGGFAVTDDPYEIDGSGTWTLLGVDPERFDMSYSLQTDVTSGRLLARVSVTGKDLLASQGGGNRWIEFVSAID